MVLDIDRLCNRPEWVDACIVWDDTAWPRTPAIETFFAEHYTAAASPHADGVPQTWVAVSDGDLVGMISLIADDHPVLTHLSPWLASAFVVPHHRGQGVFRRLHDALCAYARDELRTPHLYVYTHMDMTHLGWIKMEDIADPFAPDKIVTLYRMDFATSSYE